MSAKKDCFFFLLIYHLFSVAVLSLKLLFSGFDTTRFQIFVCFDIYQFFTFSNFVTLSHYWRFSCHLISIQNKAQLNILKSWNIYIIVLTASTPLSWRNRLNFLILSLTVIYTLSFRSYEISFIVIAFIGFSWKNRRTDILILVDSWWLSWLWKQSFSKILKKNFLTSQFCSFYVSFCYLISLVNYRPNMTLWV